MSARPRPSVRPSGPRASAALALDSQAAGTLSAVPFFGRWDVRLLVVLATAVPLAYAFFTEHIWEDYFITFRHSQNLVDGRGLRYNPGQPPVHGFTSPLGVLLPALCYLVTGKTGYLPALWMFRILSLAAFVGGGLLVLWRLGTTLAGRRAAWAFGLLYLLEVKGVANAVDGMETGFMLLFVGWALALFESRHTRAWVLRGLAWGGLMWTRPDGCVYVAALSVAELAFGTGDRKRFFLSLAKSAVVTTVVYLPWFVFAWSYYGSPVPQTIQAKTPSNQSFDPGLILSTVYARLPHRAAVVFGPIYFPLFWPGPEWVYWFSYAVAAFCLAYWLLPVDDRVGRMASLGFTLLACYLSYMALPFPWYLPPVGLLGLVALARGAVTLARAAATAIAQPVEMGRVADLLTIIALTPVAMGLSGLFGYTARQIRIQEKEIEMGNRRPMGLWLKDHMAPDEVLFLEPIGYVGYFSQARIQDWPGLVSPDVVAQRKRGVTMELMPNVLKPAWVVLRPHEARLAVQKNPEFTRTYVPVKLFDVKDRLRSYGPIPGSPYVVLDSTYLIFRRRASATESVPAGLRAEAREAARYLAEVMAQPTEPPDPDAS